MTKVLIEKFKFLEHTADIKFKAFGNSIKEVFENSALALFRVFYDKKVEEKKAYKIKVKGNDLESLLYNFLEEFLVLFDSKNFLPFRIKNLELNEKKFKISAVVVGDELSNYNAHVHVKAITYSGMFVKKQKNNWVSQVLVDV
ncbi:archease [Candidatus Pacearchaeota archaeon]|nr:archease [Candidatus Pacearchaeota archaeon]